MSSEAVTGLNILKGGADPPLKPDEELPDWLWELAAPPKTLNVLKRSQEEALSSADVSQSVAELARVASALLPWWPGTSASVSPPCGLPPSLQLERLVKLENRHGIKVRNDDRSK